MDLVDRYFAWADRTAAAAMAAEQTLIQVVDLNCASMPVPQARRRALDHVRNSLLDEVTLTRIVATDDFILRGIVNAMDWAKRSLGLSRKSGGEFIVVEEVGGAIDIALAHLYDARIPAPFGLSRDQYEAPSL